MSIQLDNESALSYNSDAKILNVSVIFYTRPSKNFFYAVLERNIIRTKAPLVLDAASAIMKNRAMFKNTRYYGLDIDLEALRLGLKNSPPDTYGIWADMSTLETLPSNSVDLIVSTNTLYKLTSLDQDKAVDHLCRITKPNGDFFLDITLSDRVPVVADLLKRRFKKVTVVYCKNPINQLYEKAFENKNKDLGYHPIASLRPFRLFAWLLGQLEYLTCRFPRLNKQVLFLCFGKISNEPTNVFDVSHLPIIEDKLYNGFPEIKKIL